MSQYVSISLLIDCVSMCVSPLSPFLSIDLFIYRSLSLWIYQVSTYRSRLIYRSIYLSITLFINRLIYRPLYLLTRLCIDRACYRNISPRLLTLLLLLPRYPLSVGTISWSWARVSAKSRSSAVKIACHDLVPQQCGYRPVLLIVRNRHAFMSLRTAGQYTSRFSNYRYQRMCAVS